VTWAPIVRRWRGVRARIDRALVRGQLSIVVWLIGAALVLAFFATVVVEVFHLRGHNENLGFADAFWQELVRTMDPGQITEDTAGFAALSFLVTVIGLLLISTLISLVNNRIERRVEGLRRGRDPIHLDPGHIAILGWSDIASRVLEELAEASPPKQPLDVAVLAPAEILQMRHELVENEALGRLGRQWPTLRSGTTWDTRDLRRLAAVHEARCVIVLHDDSGEGVPDTIKTVMAVVAACDGPRHSARYEDHPTLVLEVPHDDSGAVAHLARRLDRFGFRVMIVESVALRNELAAQVTRRAGLSEIYRDLLDFAGHELYFAEPPEGLVTFGEAVGRLAATVPIGVFHGGAEPEVDLWPSWDEPLAGAKLVVLSEDLATAVAGELVVDASAIDGPRPTCSVRPLERQTVLVVGWNAGASHLVEVLDQYAGAGSTLTVVTDHEQVTSIPSHLLNLAIDRVIDLGGNLQAWLEETRDHFDHAVVLSNDHKTDAASDADTFLTLLALRPAGLDHGNPTTVVAQLRERSNKHLARQSLADDLIVGDSLTATVLAQLAVTPDLLPVLSELIGQTPFTLDLVDAAWFGIEADRPFLEVTRDVAGSGEIALGWRDASGSLRLNPPKSSVMPAGSLVAVLTRVAHHAT